LNFNDNLKIGIRIEKPGTLLRDYHTIMPLDKGDQIPTAEGKNKKGAIVSERYYLQNAFFLIIISGEESELICIKDALLNPKWVTYLGRKSCVPTKPVYKEISFDYESLEEALKKYPLERKKDEKMFYLCEIEDVNGDYSRNDIPLNNKSRDYRERKIKRFNVEL
jgi:CRISPR system Cascade subunit CasD